MTILTQDKTQTDTIKRKLAEIMSKHPNAYIIAMDGMEVLYCSELKNKFSDRIISGGIQEQNALSMAAGLALSGKLVYIIMLGFYAYCRAFDQLKLDIGYNNANVKIIAHGTGLWGAMGGYSHWGIEDLALLRTISHMQIVSPINQEEIEYFMDYSAKNLGPMYIRFDFPDNYSKYQENAPYKQASKPEFGKLSTYRKGKDFTIITYGGALDYTKILESKLNAIGLQPEIIVTTTIEPFDENGLLNLFKQNKPIISIGEHCRGGLEAIINNIIVKSNKKVRYYPVYVNQDNYAFSGSRHYYFEQLSDFKLLPNIILNLCSKSYLFGILQKKHSFRKNNTSCFRTTIKVCGLPLLSIRHRSNSSPKTKIKFCGLPFLTIKYKKNKAWYRLFGFTPIYKRKIRS